MTFSLRRKRPTTPRRGRPTPTAATISLAAGLLLAAAGHAPAQAPAQPDWHPARADGVQPVSSRIQIVEPVQLKTSGPRQLPPPPKLDTVPSAPQQAPPSRIGVPGGTKIRASEDEAEFTIQTEPPGLDRLTQRLSEDQFYEKLRQEARRRPGAGRIYFPEEEPVSTEPFTGRQYPWMARFVEPNYVCHKPLYFEQKNFERYGWDLGPANVGIEVGKYYYDLVMLPYHIGSQACHCYDCSAGKCLPGDPTPLLLYPERFSLTGLVFETGTVLGITFALH